jgi:hypothetical protein
VTKRPKYRTGHVRGIERARLELAAFALAESAGLTWTAAFECLVRERDRRPVEEPLSNVAP